MGATLDCADPVVEQSPSGTATAGRYMAFKVGTTGTQHDDWYETTWYSPQLGAVVKGAWGRTDDNGYGPLEGSWELVSVEFKQALGYRPPA